MFVSVIVAAAGLGLRLNKFKPKPLIKLKNKPIFVHTLDALIPNPNIKEIILVVSQNILGSTKRYLNKYKLRKIKHIVIGGSRRCDSVKNALGYVSPCANLIMIHDAVRPFIEKDLISRVINKAARSGAAIPAVAIKSAIKEIDSKQRVIKTLKRDKIYEVQTPQVFKRALIINAYRSFSKTQAVDDSTLVERLGKKVSVVLGSYLNIKITTAEDLIFARSILEGRFFCPSRDGSCVVHRSVPLC